MSAEITCKTCGKTMQAKDLVRHVGKLLPELDPDDLREEFVYYCPCDSKCEQLLLCRDKDENLFLVSGHGLVPFP